MNIQVLFNILSDKIVNTLCKNLYNSQIIIHFLNKNLERMLMKKSY
jgi:hypothetical protein